MLQATFLQILFDYVHVPCLILAILLFAMWTEKRPNTILRCCAVCMAIAAFFISPLARPSRLSLWPRCLREASGPVLRNELRRVADPDWEDLERVAQFLEEQQVVTGDVVCYNNHLIHLYPRLGIQPTIRYVYQATWHRNILGQSSLNRIFRNIGPATSFPTFTSRAFPIQLARADGPQGPLSLPAEFPANARRIYPWRHPIVFRAGAYLVHEYPPAKAKSSVK